MNQFVLLDEKKRAKDLVHGDHIMVGDQLWRVIKAFRSQGNPNCMLQLAYHTHVDPQTFKFHPVRDEERFEVFHHWS